MNAARYNNVDLVKSLLDSGLDAKATHYFGLSALMWAAKYGYDKSVELLLPFSDAKATSNSGYSALMLAAEHGYYKSVELLLPLSDAKATTNSGYSALMVATQWSENAKSVELLLPFSDAKARRTALYLAKYKNPFAYKSHGRNQIVRLLQQYSN